MKKFAFILACSILLVGSGWASYTGTTNPTQFNDLVNWCQYGCAGTQYASPQSWISVGGNTGMVGLNGTLQGFYNLQQGNGWNGGFPPAMGLIYNGAFFGNIPTGIAATFDQGVMGAGAWVQDNYLAYPYTATIQVFDSNYLLLASYSVNIPSYTAGFLGILSTSADIWAVQFDISDGYNNEDFAMGTLKLNTVPEPGTITLFASSALGLAGYIRRRFKGVL